MQNVKYGCQSLPRPFGVEQCHTELVEVLSKLFLGTRRLREPQADIIPTIFA